jgi:hypothetical protein
MGGGGAGIGGGGGGGSTGGGGGSAGRRRPHPVATAPRKQHDHSQDERAERFTILRA